MQQTIHSAVVRARLQGAEFINYIKKIEGDEKVEAELQQGVFNDVNELGTSKKKRKKKAKK